MSLQYACSLRRGFLHLKKRGHSMSEMDEKADYKTGGADRLSGAVKRKVKEEESVVWAKILNLKKPLPWESMKQANQGQQRTFFTIALRGCVAV